MLIVKDELLNKIHKALGGNPDLVGQPATDTEIAQAETILNVKFNDQYIEFIKNFGGAYAGFGIHAFHNSFFSGKSTVVDLTERFRRGMRKEFAAKAGSLYAISIDGSGNPILMDSGGGIYAYWHDENKLEIIYRSLEDLLNEVKWEFMPQ
jgi:hypothetical protein